MKNAKKYFSALAAVTGSTVASCFGRIMDLRGAFYFVRNGRPPRNRNVMASAGNLVENAWRDVGLEIQKAMNAVNNGR